MDIFPKKDNFQRSEQELRLQPFILLSSLLLAVLGGAAITYVCVYSDSKEELIKHSLWSGILISAPLILFIHLWRKESKRPLPMRARKVAWKFMFVSYLAINAAVVALAIFAKNPETSRLHAVTCVALGLPFGVILWQLVRSKTSTDRR